MTLRRAARCMVPAMTAATLIGTMISGASPAGATRLPTPTVKLIAAQRSVTAPSFRGRVFLNPGIWVASLRVPLEFQVRRASYTQPVTITQILPGPHGTSVARKLPSSLLDGWQGLRDFVTMTVRDSAGKVVATQRLTLCPNSWDPERVSPSGPIAPHFPQFCGFNPFTKGMVWGIQKGWAVNPVFSFGGAPLKLKLGKYQVTETITPRYAKLFRITKRNATATVKVKVVKARGCCGSSGHVRARPLPAAPAVPTLARPPRSAMPDMVPLPSFGIGTVHLKRAGKDLLHFDANVWIGGHSRLDVQGFRSNGSPVMKAYQYFWRNGRLIGRARAGTMGFDTRKGHSHWHFEQFAQYRLLNKFKKLAVRSHKQGFCIAPTDPIDILLKNSTWHPFQIGLEGACGDPAALWVREMLPIGWGDTYDQFSEGQAFDITSLPNGTYYIEVIANPEKVLHETNTRNDTTLRKVILGGKPGQRTVKVPAWHGIDPEH